ncbi:MAG: hypothetical protein HFI75_13840 [Lachnospiraceae bacterium]|nr:hypothetical protein [Lachnospiraceae bacterium]
MEQREKEKRRERLMLFSNKNQWIKKKDMEQTLEEMSAQLREYRRDLQQIRMQEAAAEAKIDRLQQQVNAIESSLHLDKKSAEKNNSQEEKITDFYEHFDTEREGYSVSYRENGLEMEQEGSTVTLYA